MFGNGWQVDGTNSTGASIALTSYAVCITQLSALATQLADQQVSIPSGESGHAVAVCRTGTTAVGGSWSMGSDGALWVYNSTFANNGWQVYAYNEDSSIRQINIYVVCLHME